MALKLYNTLTREKELFVPHEKNLVRMYNCGPTVYWRMQLGNIRAYANWDILHRTLLYLGYDVDRVVNFTDVGHMTEDEDFGDDKIENTARSEGKTPQEISDHFINTVTQDFYSMNYLQPDGSQTRLDMTPDETKDHGWARATLHIEDMIAHNKMIEVNGFTYETEQALYFDVTKLPDYTKLSRQVLSDKLVGVRDEVIVDPNKKNPADFVLWMKRTGKYAKHLQHWESPWGDGFPGWHIECSAMGCKYLGEYIDIHTGGVDHISVHHTNERAQNIGAYGHEVVRFWLHNEFLTNKEGDKFSKSKGNAFTLVELREKGYDPLDLRYYFMSIHYRQPIRFSEDGLESAKNARKSLIDKILSLVRGSESLDEGDILKTYDERFRESLMDDLNVSSALAVVSELLGSESKDSDKVRTILEFDRVLGLRLRESIEKALEKDLPSEVQDLVDQRAKARAEKDYQRSDDLRDRLKEMGYEVLDGVNGQDVRKIVL